MNTEWPHGKRPGVWAADLDDFADQSEKRWCFKGGSSAPAPPDPAATAAAQAQANREASIAGAEISMVDQITPYGSLTFDQIGTTSNDNPRYQATQTLAPNQQYLSDLTDLAGIQYGETANTQLSNVRDKLSSPLDFSGLGARPMASEATRQATRDAILSRMEPDFARDEEALRSRLANMGFQMGSEGYQDAMFDFGRAKTDARLAADAQAGNEMSRMFGLESASRDAAINEQIMGRTQPLNELAAMMSGSQVQGPQFVNTPQTSVAPADVIGATYASYNGALNNYNQQQSQGNALMGGLFGLGSAAITGGLF